MADTVDASNAFVTTDVGMGLGSEICATRGHTHRSPAATALSTVEVLPKAVADPPSVPACGNLQPNKLDASVKQYQFHDLWNDQHLPLAPRERLVRPFREEGGLDADMLV